MKIEAGAIAEQEAARTRAGLCEARGLLTPKELWQGQKRRQYGDTAAFVSKAAAASAAAMTHYIQAAAVAAA